METHGPTDGDDGRDATRMGQAKEHLSEAVEQTRAAFGDAAETTKDTARGVAEQQKRAGADRIDTLASAVHGAAKEIEPEMPQAAGYIRDAADRLANMSSTLRERSLDDLVGQLGEFARRQPAMFFGGAVLAGVALSRFLKSSGEGAPGRHRPQGGRP
jgi:hypothetical protein